MSEQGLVERVARAICKAVGQNPDTCVMGSSGFGFRDNGEVIMHSKCYRRAWEEHTRTAQAAIAAVADYSRDLVKAEEPRP